MLIPGGAKITGTSGLTRTYPAQTHSIAPAQKGDFARRFDSVTISGDNGVGSFAMELKSRVTQEVRTATSSETVAAIREQVQNGTYQIDAREIARKMLLEDVV